MEPILLDADGLVYEIGFASQETIGDQVIATKTDKEIRQFIFDWIRWLQRTLSSDQVEFFLSDSTNNRVNISTINKYKEQRGVVAKPLAHGFIRQIFLEKYKAEISPGLEGDDLLAARATEYDAQACIASLDKDLLQVPSYNYRWARGTAKEHPRRKITREEGRHFFYTQLIVGDWAVDRIPGLFGKGMDRANKYLRPIYGASDEEYMARVLDLYLAEIKKHKGKLKFTKTLQMEQGEDGVFRYTDWRGNELERTLEEVVSEIGSLLHLKRNLEAPLWSVGKPVHGDE